MNTCDHCGTELSYGHHDIEGTVVSCNACDWASPMMERRYLDLSPSKETLANVAMTLDRALYFLNRAQFGRVDDNERRASARWNEIVNAVRSAALSLRYWESESRD